jgi:hypothetical protein
MPTANYPLLVGAAVTGSAVAWPGGPGTFIVDRGTFSGATVALQASFDGGVTWLPVDRAGETFVTFTAAGAGNFALPECHLRAAISGGAPVAMYATARGHG